MNKQNRVGIWMDHVHADVVDISNAEPRTSSITCAFSHEERQESLHKSESLMHQKEQQEQGLYYKQLGAVIINYDEVLLFGPTNAKLELLNVLRADPAFSRVKIEVKSADKMSAGQQLAFVKEHFSK